MKKDFFVAIVVAIVIVAVCYGVAAARPNLPPPPITPIMSESTAGASTAATTRPPSNSPVVMRVNGEPVTEEDFQSFLQQAPEQMQAFYASPDGRRLLAQEIVKFKALEQEGRRLGVDSDPVAASRIDMARGNIVAAYALQKLVPKPDEARLRAEYEKEKKNLDTIQLSHILIAFQGASVPGRSGAQRSFEDAMKKANAIVAQLRGGADFAQMARAQSDDSGSAANGGSLGAVSPAALPPDMQPTVMRLKNGEVSNPVRSTFGVHIFKMGAHSGRTYEEMKPLFLQKLQRDDAEATVLRLQKAAKVDLDPKFFSGSNGKP